MTLDFRHVNGAVDSNHPVVTMALIALMDGAQFRDAAQWSIGEWLKRTAKAIAAADAARGLDQLIAEREQF